MTLSRRSVSIVAPVHQQQGHIAHVLRDMYGAILDLTDRLEFLVVINASTDGSADECRSLESECPGIRVIERTEPGWGGAVRAGVALATGELICFTNTARTTAHDLRTAVALGLLNEGFAVKAVRRSRDKVLRRLGSVLYNLEVRALFDLASWDVNGTPKIFPRSFDALSALRDDGDLLDLEWLVTCKQREYPLIEYPVTSVQRHGGRSTTGIPSALKMYRGAVSLRSRMAITSDPSRQAR